MITTLYLLQFIAFYLWQITSKRVKQKQTATNLHPVTENPKASRWAGGILLLLTSVLFVIKLGIMSGLCAFVVGLMGVGCLSVALQPFKYLHFSSVAILYVVCLLLEILI